MKSVIWTLLAGTCAATYARASTPRAEWLGKLPLRFEKQDKRDHHSNAKYAAYGTNFVLSLAATESRLEWRDPKNGKSAQIETRFAGANRGARLEPADRLPGLANYFLGSQENWRTDVGGYGRIRYRGVYDGIDLIFHGEQGRLEYDFVLAPNADPRVIRLELTGQRGLRVADDGDLVVSAAAGDIRWKRPEIYQEARGRRQSVNGRFVIANKRAVTFEVGDYDRSRELVIDPALSYSTYIGGSLNEGARGIGLDASGNVYIAGNTTSSNLPTISAYQANFGGQTANYLGGDAFVAKFSPSGALVYLTYLGGSADDGASSLAVDPAGNVYLTGQTTSTNFPTVGAYQATFGGMGGNAIIRTGDAFVTKLNPSGNQLIYSTYLGGNQDDSGTAITIDSAGNAYIAGATRSMNFPVTTGAYQAKLAGVGGEPIKPCCDLPSWDPGDAFVAKLDPTGATLVFSTYLGGTSDDNAFTIALDSANNVYVGGCTISSNFPTTAGAFQQVWGGSEPQNEFLNSGDGFVTKLNPAGTALVYSTFFGGGGDDCVSAIAVDSTGNVYMTGSTSTMNLPTTPGALQPAYRGYVELPFEIEHLYGDAFAAKLNPTGSALVYLTYLGGRANDGGTAIAIDTAGDAYITGFTDSTDFPVAGSPLQSTLAGDGGQAALLLYGDAFLTVVNPTGTALLYSTYYGGNMDDVGFGLALDGTGKVYMVGETVSTNLPTTPDAVQKGFGGEGSGNVGFVKGDAFYTVISGFAANAPVVAKVANAEGESLIIAGNTWTEVKGGGLASHSRTWQGPDFVNGQLPTELDNISVTMNGEKAYVYYISSSQINVLTPPDLAPGPVQVQVNNNGAISAEFTAQAQALSCSFFVFSGGIYVVALHANGTDIGPATLIPGLTTPAKPGEEILVFANGFGPTVPPVVKGSEVQSGKLPVLPVVSIGGHPAKVAFAGVISPGLYQFNVVVPASLTSGDFPITATYQGSTTQAGVLLSVQP